MPASPSAGAIAAIVDPLIEKELADTGAPSLTIEIARDGVPLYVQAYGQADLATCRDATATTPYEIGSVTKQFTAAALLSLVEAGQVSLDAPLVTYIPDYRFDAAITVRMLLNQTSGLADYLALGGSTQQLIDGVTEQQVLSAIVASTAHFPPGSAFEYSNSNYYLLGVIIERVSGTSFENYLQAHVLAPAGMTHTSLAEPIDAALPYSFDNPSVPGSTGRSPGIVGAPSVWFSAGGLWSTVGDLAAWDNALFDGRVLTASSVLEMVTPPAGVPTLGQSAVPSTYAMGWVSGIYNGNPVYWHNGQTAAYTAFNAVFPETRWSLTILSNLDVTERTPFALLGQSIIASVCPTLTGAQSCT